MARNVFRFLLTLLALAMAYGAQMLFDGKLPAAWVSRWSPPMQFNLACGLYVAAMVIFGLAALPPAEAITPTPSPRPKRRRDEPDARIVRPAWRPKPKEARATRTWLLAGVRLLIVLAAVGLGVAASIMFWRQGESATVRRLWLGSMAALLVSQLRWSRGQVVGWSDGQRPSDQGLPDLLTKAIELVLLALILSVAFFLRFYLLETIPHDFHGDMASHGLQARALLEGRQPHIFGTMWAEIPTMGFIPAALSMAVFGNDLFGLRMTSVIGGTLTVLGLYLLAGELFRNPNSEFRNPLSPWPASSGHRVPLLAASLLAISYVHIHFSRIAEYMDPWPFALFSLYFLMRGLSETRRQGDILRQGEGEKGRQGEPSRRRLPVTLSLCHPVSSCRRVSFIVSGLLLAFCLLMYYSARVVPVIIIVFLAYALLLRRDLLRGNWGGLVLFGLALLLGMGPMIPFYARHPYNFVIRSRVVFLFYPPVMEHLMGKYGVDTVSAVVKEQLKRSLLMFHHSIDSSTQFGLAKPMLDPYTSPLLVLGLGYALRRFRRAGHALTVIWLLLILFMGSMLTNNAPFWPRLVGILPPAALLVALAVDRIWAQVEQMWGDTGSALMALLVVAGLIFVGMHNWQLYYHAVEDNARPRARIGRYLYGLDPDINACLISEPFQLSVREIAFLAYPRATYDLPPDAHGAALDACPGPRRVFILTPNHLDLLPELQARYPGGVTQEHREASGNLIFVSYLLEQ